MWTANAVKLGDWGKNETNRKEKAEQEREAPPAKRKRDATKARWTKQQKRERKRQSPAETVAIERSPKKNKKRLIIEAQAVDSVNDRYSLKKMLSQIAQSGVQGARRILLIAGATRYTGSVAIVDNEKRGEGVQVVTTTQRNYALIQNATICQSMARIYAKPLLVLDINGVLCHRIRGRTLPLTVYRESLSKPIAMTKIVLRPQLDRFLDYVFRHFCVAIWTSAQAKTAKELVCKLIRPQHQNKLLFVWNQNDCVRTISKDPSSGENKTTFRKDLVRVWNYFPLWSTLNTVLVDDSPRKSTDATQMNMVNPIPLHGKDGNFNNEKDFLSDEENVEQQQVFFESLVDLWETNCVVKQWENELEVSMVRCSGTLTTFLQKQSAESNIGWSAGHIHDGGS